MKLKYCICIICSVFFAISCQKDLLVRDAPDFAVSTEATSYKVNEPVEFKIEGKADIISFYSGEVFHEYEFREGREVDVTGQGLNLSFNSAVAPGTPTGTQENQFSILTSTNFNGNYADLNSVKAAVWQDISGRFELATSATFKPSTKQDISDLLVTGKPLYFAFRYINRPQIENGFARQWMIENFSLTSNAEINEKPITIYDQVHTGFRIVDQDTANMPARSSITTSRITMYGPIYKDPDDPIYDPNNPIFDPKNPIYDKKNPAYIPGARPPIFVPYVPDSPYNDPYSENWAVSGPITVGKVNLGSDWAMAVRGGIYLGNPTLYTYKYTKPGIYKAVFVASNNTIKESKQVVREITVTITQ